MNQLIEQIKAWGIAKGITGTNGKGTLLGQLAKTQEELTETRDAAVWRMHASNYAESYRAKMAIKDGIGDTAVTLILAAEMLSWDLNFHGVQTSKRDELLEMLSFAQKALSNARDAGVRSKTHDRNTLERSDEEGICLEAMQIMLNCMITAADIAGLTMEECLQAAYDEIKGRTGKMENGVFVKDQQSA